MAFRRKRTPAGVGGVSAGSGSAAAGSGGGNLSVKPDWIIVGLGNPGPKFAGTRHNVGADVISYLTQKLGAAQLKSRHSCDLWTATLQLPAGDGDSDGADADAEKTTQMRREANLLLAIPISFMNESGNPVRKLIRQWRVSDFERLVIIHDDLDLPPGRSRLKSGGGLGGHNGLISIRSQLATADFTRVRLGVGKPPSKEQGADYVLSRPPPAERELLEESVWAAADSICEMVTHGLQVAISRQS